MNHGTRIHETLFASTEGRFLGVGLALTGLMLLGFGHAQVVPLNILIETIQVLVISRCLC
jgi:hypothetical protein